MTRRTLSACAAIALFASGCLAPSYRLSQDELLRLAAENAATRGQSVRVVQDIGQDRVARAAATPTHPAVVVAPVHVGVRVSATNVGGTSSSSSGGGGSNGKGIAIAVIVLAALGGFVLAGTEGARYDGEVAVGPLHPLHLLGPGGAHYWVPMNQLDMNLAAWASEGVLFDDEGEFRRLGRAPLERRGGAFELRMGGTTVPNERGDTSIAATPGFTVGGFPIHQFGLMAGLDTGFGIDRVEWRLFGEAQGFPISVANRRFELGLYARGGMAWGVVDQPFAGGGFIAQVGLTTRLAFLLRGGISYLFDSDDIAPTIQAGFAVY